MQSEDNQTGNASNASDAQHARLRGARSARDVNNESNASNASYTTGAGGILPPSPIPHPLLYPNREGFISHRPWAGGGWKAMILKRQSFKRQSRAAWKFSKVAKPRLFSEQASEGSRGYVLCLRSGTRLYSLQHSTATYLVLFVLCCV